MLWETGLLFRKTEPSVGITTTVLLLDTLKEAFFARSRRTSSALVRHGCQGSIDYHGSGFYWFNVKKSPKKGPRKSGLHVSKKSKSVRKTSSDYAQSVYNDGLATVQAIYAQCACVPTLATALWTIAKFVSPLSLSVSKCSELFAVSAFSM